MPKYDNTLDIDLNYRPESYFGPQNPLDFQISQVKGAVVRRRLEKLLAEGHHDKVREILANEGASASELRSLESIHPMFMGGNYLPDAEEGEVEIARIEIDSTTFDVTSLLARPVGAQIRYQVVDEYEGGTLTGCTSTVSDWPMTLKEMADFFLGAWPLIEVLERNFEGDLEPSLAFFTAKSRFYPDFDRLCRKYVTETFAEKKTPEKAAPPGQQV